MKKLILFLGAAGVISLGACNQGSTTTDSTTGNNNNQKSEQMKSRYRIIAKAFETGNTAGIDTLLTSNAVDHAQNPDHKVPDGPAGLKQMITEMHQNTPDLKQEITHMATDGDVLIAYGTMSGTNTGSSPGMPATNKKWSAEFADVIKFNSDMKMTEHWGVYDMMKIMKDLGMSQQGAAPTAAHTADTTKKKM